MTIKSFVESCVCTDETPIRERCDGKRAVILDAARPLMDRISAWLKPLSDKHGAGGYEVIKPSCLMTEEELEAADGGGEGWLSITAPCGETVSVQTGESRTEPCEGVCLYVGNLYDQAARLTDLITVTSRNTELELHGPKYDAEGELLTSASPGWCKGCAQLFENVERRLQLISGVKPGAVDWAFQALKRRIGGGEVKWLIPGIMQKGELAALFGPPKSGKSLLALEWAAKLATERKRVLYLDEENSAEAVFERLLDMGYEDVPRFLEYHSFGGYSVDKAPPVGQDHPIVTLAKECGAALVVFDSYAKFFSAGSQNDDAAINRAYALVLKPLRALGIAVLRLDHTGHGETRRPAGSVQKLADVDHNWLIRAEDAPGRSARKVTLTHTENRTGRGADLITLKREIGPLRHVEAVVEALDDGQAAHTEPGAAVKAIIERLDAMSIPLDWGRGRCMEALKANGGGVKVENLSEAIRRRQE